MSRLIVKGLPRSVTAEKLKKHFEIKGTVTDCQLKYTKSGQFRHFAFIGYAGEDEADEAVDYFDKTFMGQSRIQVSKCLPFGEASKPRAWSKYAKDSSAYQKLHKVPRTTAEDSSSLACNASVGDKVYHNAALIRGLPNSVKVKNLKKFLTPLKPKVIKILKPGEDPPVDLGASIATTGNECTILVAFGKPSDLAQVLKRNGEFFGGVKLEIEALGNKEPDTSNAPAQETAPLPHLHEDLQSEERAFASKIADTGRIFLRNLPYVCTEEELEKLLSEFGPLTELIFPTERETKKPKGFAVATFLFPEHALNAYVKKDGTIFKGRMLHILPGEGKPEDQRFGPVPKSGMEQIGGQSSFKKEREAEVRKNAPFEHNWNTLFLGANAVADVVSERLNVRKDAILDKHSNKSLSVRMTLAETQLVQETRNFLIDNGVAIDCFGKPAAKRSKTVLIVKNLPAGTNEYEIKELFAKFGHIARIILPPSGIAALVEFEEGKAANVALKAMAYERFKTLPLFLEFAPREVFNPLPALEPSTSSVSENEKISSLPGASPVSESGGSSETTVGKTIFVKNLNFDTTSDSLRKHFEPLGLAMVRATVAQKPDHKNPGKFLSMGYGFVEFGSSSDAKQAIKERQNTSLDGHTLNLQLSERAKSGPQRMEKSNAKSGSEKSETKILVRNIAFQATKKEIREIFATFGELKLVRLPSKTGGLDSEGHGRHRGFGFVEFLTKTDAKRAFDELSLSTHLYGRRLVLEWASETDTLEDIRKRTAEHFVEDGGIKSKMTKFKRNVVTDIEKSLDY